MKRDLPSGELIAALAVCLFGAGAIWIARDYSMGTVTRMGAGYVPVMLGILLIAMGAVLAWQARAAGPADSTPALRPFALIMGGILAWALIVERLGFVAATVVLVVCCSGAEPRSTVWSTLALAAGLTVGGYLLFVTGLNIPLSAFGD